MHKKVYLILVLVTVLSLGVWTASPARHAAAQPAKKQTPACETASTQLVGRTSEIPGVQELIQDLCDFRITMRQVPSHVSELDKGFIEHAIASNMLEIQSLEIALQNTDNEEWQGLIRMMIIMHTSELEMALAVAEKTGADTTPDLTNAMVYPETPDYNLGIRRVNLVEKFIDPLMNAAGEPTGTPTAIPTDLTGTATPPPFDTPTGTAIDTPTMLPPETATDTPTDIPTETATPPPFDTPSGTATGTSTDIPMETATNTPTDLSTETATILPTDIFTATPTGVSTSTPPGSGTGVNFDILALHIIEEEHVMHIETALVAQRLVRNRELRAFARHAADAAQLHLLLMNDLKHRLADHFLPPTPNFEEDYLPPRRPR